MTHLAYDGTLQTVQLALVSAKLRSSLMLEGHMQTDGLAALEGDEGDTFVQLARRLTQEADDETSDAQAALDELAAFEAEGNDDMLSEETREELARQFAERAETPEVIDAPPAVEPVLAGAEAPPECGFTEAEFGDPVGVAAKLSADDVPQTTLAASPREEPCVPAQARQLSFLALRDELARRGVRLPRTRARKPAPGQVSLFDR